VNSKPSCPKVMHRTNLMLLSLSGGSLAACCRCCDARRSRIAAPPARSPDRDILACAVTSCKHPPVHPAAVSSHSRCKEKISQGPHSAPAVHHWRVTDSVIHGNAKNDGVACTPSGGGLLGVGCSRRVGTLTLICVVHGCICRPIHTERNGLVRPHRLANQACPPRPQERLVSARMLSMLQYHWLTQALMLVA
jgi:hypothetical protein